MNPLTYLSMARSPYFFKMLGLISDWKAMTRLHFLHAAVESGLLSALDVPRSRDELIAALEVVNEEYLDGLLDVGRAVGELAFRNGRFAIKGTRARNIRDDREEALAAFVQGTTTYYNSVYRHAAARMKGAGKGDYLDWIGPMVAKYSKIGEPLIRALLQETVARKKRLRILEIGCGSGIHLKIAHEVNPLARGIGLDIDGTVVETARENLRRWGLSHEFEIFQGDIRDPADRPEGRFDLITMYNLIYYFEEDQRQALAEKLGEQLSDGGRLVIAANFQSDGRHLSSANLNLATTSMMGCTPLPDLEDFKKTLTDSGYRIIRAEPLMPKTAYVGLIAGRDRG